MTVDPSDLSLYQAIENDDPATLRRLLSSGTRPVYVDPGWSPLHHAVDAESDFRRQAGSPLDLRLIAPLIEAGADINALTQWAGRPQQTPLDFATDYQNDAAIAAITNAGGRRASVTGS